MVNEAKGTLYRKKDDKYLLYIPRALVEDSMFPFEVNPAVRVKVSYKDGDEKLTIEKWEDETES